MKRLSTILIVINLLFVGIMSVSCGGGKGDEPAPPTPPTPTPPVPETPASITITGEAANGLNFASDGGTKSLTFTASASWSVTVSGGVTWCKVSPASGSSSSASVTVTVEPNTGYDDRNVSLTVACGSLKKTVVVTQKQANALLVTSGKVEMPSAGGQFTAEVKANVDYSVTVPEQFGGWISQSGSRGLKTSHVTFTVAPSESFDPREGYVLFSGAGIEERVNVYQSGEERQIILGKKEVSVPAEGETFAVELQSNCEYTVVMPGVDWLKRAEGRAMSSHTLYFTASPYTNTDAAREARVEFRSDDGTLTETLTVTQMPKGAIIISTREVKVSLSGETFSIRFASNVSPSTKILDGGESWIERRQSGRSRAMEERELWFEAKANGGTEQRSARIVITQMGNESVADTVNVIQEGSYFSFTTSMVEGDFADAAGHTFTVDVNTNIVFEVSIPAFLERIEDETTTRTHMKFSIAPNYTAGVSRSGYISFTAGGKNFGQIPVSQQAPSVTVGGTTYPVDYKGGIITPEIDANLEIAVSVAEKYAGWISVEPPVAGSFIPRISVAENTATTDRSAVISLSAGTFWKRAVSIKQSGCPAPPENVTLPVDGSLADQIPADRAMELQSISISGNIDGADVELLRKMATEGSLTNLDLSGATLVKSDEPYITLYGPKYIEKDNAIGEYMFAGTHLQYIKLPANLKEIGKKAFDNSALLEIDVPEGVTDIGRAAFHGCQAMKRATLPSTLGEVPEDCFTQTTSLEYVTIKDGPTVIGENAFFFYPGGANLNSGLREVSIPSSVKEIRESAFGHSGIESVIIPESVTVMGNFLFGNCQRLKSVVIKGVPADGVLPDRTFFQCSYMTDLQLPEGLKVIGEFALYSTEIRELVVPSTVVEIRAGAFGQCGMSRLVLPEGLETIGEAAFAQMYRLSSITLPSTVKSVGANLLSCTINSLKEIHCRMTTPPATAGDLVYPDRFDFNSCTLYVPKGSKAAYQSAQYWNLFTNIVEE